MKIILKITRLLIDYITDRSGFSVLLLWLRFLCFFLCTLFEGNCGVDLWLCANLDWLSFYGGMFLLLFFFSFFHLYSYCDELVKKFMWYFTVVIFYDTLVYSSISFGLQCIPAVAAEHRKKKAEYVEEN